MALQLSTIVSAVRGLHPAFDRTRVPDKTLASAFSEYQNTLIGLAVAREKTYVSQSIAIAVAAGATFAEDADLTVDLTASGIPFTSERSGYAVQLDANGNPYIDPAAPLLVSVEQGVALPIVLACIGGTVRGVDGSPTEQLCITSYGRRFDPPWFPAVYFVDQMLHLVGEAADWNGVSSIELRVTPFAPAFTSLDEYFLVPDGARQCLVAYGASVAAERVAAYAQADKNPTPDLNAFAVRAAAAETRYLSTLRLTKRAMFTTMQDGGGSGWL